MHWEKRVRYWEKRVRYLVVLALAILLLLALMMIYAPQYFGKPPPEPGMEPMGSAAPRSISDQILSELAASQRRMRHEVSSPPQMQVGEWSHITLVVSPPTPVPGSPGTVADPQIAEIGLIAQAVLLVQAGEAEMQRTSTDTLLIDGTRPVEWRWRVKPKTEKLSLQLDVLSSVPGQPDEVNWIGFQQTIEPEVLPAPLWDRVRAFTTSWVGWLFGAIAGIAGLFATLVNIFGPVGQWGFWRRLKGGPISAPVASNPAPAAVPPAVDSPPALPVTENRP